jgi:hypothetical protein
MLKKITNSSDLTATGTAILVYGFSNNDFAGFVSRTANRFKAQIGLPVV